MNAILQNSHFFVYGIGNPSEGSLKNEFIKTRHNIGKRILQKCYENIGCQWQAGKGGSCFLAAIPVQEFMSKIQQEFSSPVTMASHSIPKPNEAPKGEVTLISSRTWMNHSGTPLHSLQKKVPPRFLLVLHDETEIPFGEIRIKHGGGHKGHNGLRSIIAELGSADFTRLRFGVGRPEGLDLASHVLSNFSPEEEQELPQFIVKAQYEICNWLQLPKNQ